MTQYEETKILEARGLRELAWDLKHQPLEVITEDEFEKEEFGNLHIVTELKEEK